MMTALLIFILFMMAMGIGYVMDGVRKDKVNFLETRESFIIQHNDRRIVISPAHGKRLCTYKWKGKVETLTFPVIPGTNPLISIEYFIPRYKTSRLIRYLLDFENMKDPTLLLAFDPANGKVLSEIQLKLKSFIRNA